MLRRREISVSDSDAEGNQLLGRLIEFRDESVAADHLEDRVLRNAQGVNEPSWQHNSASGR